MTELLLDPFATGFLQRALMAGLLTAVTCAVVGTWVVLRGLSFMGDALAHGVLPGIALAYVLAGPGGLWPVVGAVVAALVVVLGVRQVEQHSRLPTDAGIGLLFVLMLSLGVIIISRGTGFVGDLVGILFGAALGVTTTGVLVAGAGTVVALTLSVLLYRPFLALSFDRDKAATLGMRPGLAQTALLGLVTLAVVTSFQTVGNLLVFGLLVGPPATASLLARRVPVMTGVAVVVGCLSVYGGLLASYHLDLAAGAAMAALAVGSFFVVLPVRGAVAWAARRRDASRTREPDGEPRAEGGSGGARGGPVREDDGLRVT